MSLHNHYRSHHVVFFVLENMAMPYILIATCPWTWWYSKRHNREIELHDDRCHFTRVHPYGLFESEFIPIWRHAWSCIRRGSIVCCHIKWTPPENLDVYQLEVYGGWVRSKCGY